MRVLRLSASFLVVLVLLSVWVCVPAMAEVKFGESWDGLPGSGVYLQEIFDYYGYGYIDVTTDYLGDTAAFYWTAYGADVVLMKEYGGRRDLNTLWWYDASDPLANGLVFAGSDSTGAATSIDFGSGLTEFGFFLNTTGMPYTYYTDPFLNGGWPQALIYATNDPYTFLIAFEDYPVYGPVDTVADGHNTDMRFRTDNDYNDMIFKITVHPTPEPGTMALFGVGAAAVALLRRRRGLV